MIIDAGTDCFRDDVRDDCVGLNRDKGSANGGKKWRKRKFHDDSIPEEWDSHRKRDMAHKTRDDFCKTLWDMKQDIDCFWIGA